MTNSRWSETAGKRTRNVLLFSFPVFLFSYILVSAAGIGSIEAKDGVKNILLVCENQISVFIFL